MNVHPNQTLSMSISYIIYEYILIIHHLNVHYFMKARTVCRKYKNDKTLGKLTYSIKTALPCVPFSWQNYELHCQSLFVFQR